MQNWYRKGRAFQLGYTGMHRPLHGRIHLLIQNPDAIGRIVDDLRLAVRQQPSFDQPKALGGDNELLLEHCQLDRAPVFSAGSGYLQTINHEILVGAALKQNAVIMFPFRPGQFVLEGEPIAYVSPASAYSSLAPTVAQSVHLGRHRVLHQDLEFGVAQIVEIAIRALSPAINDTFTGVACVDLLGEALTVLSTAPKHHGCSFDLSSTIRVQVRPVLVSRLIKQAFDQIRQAAADNPAVSIRLLHTIGRLGAKMSHQDQIETLSSQALAVWESAMSKSPVTMDQQDLEAALKNAQTLLTASEPKMQQPLLSASTRP